MACNITCQMNATNHAMSKVALSDSKYWQTLQFDKNAFVMEGIRLFLHDRSNIFNYFFNVGISPGILFFLIQLPIYFTMVHFYRLYIYE